MKIRSAVPENGCLIFCGRKKNKKTSVKHISIRLIGGCVKQQLIVISPVLMTNQPRAYYNTMKNLQSFKCSVSRQYMRTVSRKDKKFCKAYTDQSGSCSFNAFMPV